MLIDLITVFPAMFPPVFAESLVGKAQEKGLVSIQTHDLRDFTDDKHHVVDDKAYGGDSGMVLKPEPLFRAVRKVQREDSHVVYLSPQGRLLTQQLALDLSKKPHLIVLCGRYEGIDERVVEALVDDEVSIGDFVLMGGELPAMVLLECVIRLVPGVVKERRSIEQDSFFRGLLDHPEYTRPEDVEGRRVPEVLLSGNHAAIAQWRREQMLERTLRRRPELLEKVELSKKDLTFLQELKRTMESGSGNE